MCVNIYTHFTRRRPCIYLSAFVLIDQAAEVPLFNVLPEHVNMHSAQKLGACVREH